jgi:hypothetical protein
MALEKLQTKSGLRCQDCGRTDPPCGFYPMLYIGTSESGGQLCWDCDKKRREEANVGNKKK